MGLDVLICFLQPKRNGCLRRAEPGKGLSAVPLFHVVSPVLGWGWGQMKGGREERREVDKETSNSVYIIA